MSHGFPRPVLPNVCGEENLYSYSRKLLAKLNSATSVANGTMFIGFPRPVSPAAHCLLGSRDASGPISIFRLGGDFNRKEYHCFDRGFALNVRNISMLRQGF